MQVKEENVASGDMFAEYIEWRSKHPSDDLMTKLLNAEFEDEHGDKRTLTREEWEEFLPGRPYEPACAT